MTDSELIAFLRQKAAGLRETRHDRLADPLGEAAARLESLLAPRMSDPDADLIAEARERWRDAHQHARTGPLLLALAARLEQLLTPPPGGPVSTARLAQIRELYAALRESMAAGSRLNHRDALRDLLAAYDDALGWLARFCNDSDAFRAGEAAGVARALGVLRGLMKRLVVDDPHYQALLYAFQQIEECRPEEPPFEALAEDNRRLREALAQIAWLTQSPTAARIAREALGGGS